MNIPQIKLETGNTIPQFGLGVYQIPSNEECEKICLKAFKLGYRHIDTAHIYGNEKGVGAAIKKSGIPRNNFFITTKLWINDFGKGKSLKEIDEMLKRLDTDYIDLLLLHWPKGKYIEAYKDMEKAFEQKKVKAIGLSNFKVNEIKEILGICKIKPAINQIELHPYAQRKDIVKICDENKEIEQEKEKEKEKVNEKKDKTTITPSSSNSNNKKNINVKTTTTTTTTTTKNVNEKKEGTKKK